MHWHVGYETEEAPTAALGVTPGSAPESALESASESAIECRCGGILEQWGNELFCDVCGQRYCPECGGEVVIEGRCGYCVACAASSCGA